MKFKGTPNLYVRFANKRIHRITGRRGFYFDENGIYETDNEVLINLLSKHFEIVKEEAVEENKTELYQCKKCDFETENKGELLAHYRKEHKKEE
jgi:hypothetical protein